MKKFLAPFLILLVSSAFAALQVDVVTIKPQPGTDTALVEYQIRDDAGTPATAADDTIVRHGEVITVPYTEATTTHELQAAALADARTKNFVPAE